MCDKCQRCVGLRINGKITPHAKACRSPDYVVERTYGMPDDSTESREALANLARISLLACCRAGLFLPSSRKDQKRIALVRSPRDANSAWSSSSRQMEPGTHRRTARGPKRRARRSSRCGERRLPCLGAATGAACSSLTRSFIHLETTPINRLNAGFETNNSVRTVCVNHSDASPEQGENSVGGQSPVCAHNEK
jgi:hypothetical protein